MGGSDSERESEVGMMERGISCCLYFGVRGVGLYYVCVDLECVSGSLGASWVVFTCRDSFAFNVSVTREVFRDINRCA